MSNNLLPSEDGKIILSTYDEILYILHNTNDGNDLAPEHLKLVEHGANCFLNAKGEIALQQLYKSVQKGYSKPWFHGIENMTEDLEGFIYWKHIKIEHYSFSDYKKEEESAIELAHKCKYLESKGTKPTLSAVLNFGEKNDK